MSFKHHMSGISLSTLHALSHLILKTIVQSRCMIIIIILILQMRLKYRREVKYRSQTILLVGDGTRIQTERVWLEKHVYHQRTKLKWNYWFLFFSELLLLFWCITLKWLFDHFRFYAYSRLLDKRISLAQVETRFHLC